MAQTYKVKIYPTAEQDLVGIVDYLNTPRSEARAGPA
mgnify:CR=1 FL=1